MLDLDDREPLGGDDQAGEDDEFLGAEPPDPLALEEEMTHADYMRLLMKMLHQAITDHIDSGDLLPSRELELAMLTAKAELEWV